MDALLNDVWSGNNARLLESVERTFPRVNVSENPEAWRVTAELPGLDEKDVQVSFESNLLLIAGKKADEKEEKGRTWYRRERRSGEFSRAIELPATIDMTKATATFQKGVLVVDVPKMPEAKSPRRTIEVKSA
jgi:HSP20 family protein